MRTNLTRFCSAAVAIAAAAIGQWILLNGENIPAGILLYLVAVSLILLAAQRDDSMPASVTLRTTLTRFRTPPRWVLGTAGLLFAVLAFTLNADSSFAVTGVTEYQFTFVGIAAWFASIVFFFAAFWQPEKRVAEWRSALRAWLNQSRSGFSFQLSWTKVALIAILTLGVFFYFYQLSAIPAEMTSDHAEKLLDVNDIREGHYPVFFVRNTGREPLQFYLTFLLMKLMGLPLGYLALKTGTALVGWLTILPTFLLAREMFDEVVGLFAAFFVATLHWPVAIARMGLRFPFTPFFAALSFCFLWRALKYQKRNDFLMAGLVMGIGLYGYTASRVVPPVALAVAALWLMIEGWRWKENLMPFAINIGLMFALVLIVFAPLLRYSLDFPEMFWYRALTRVASVEKPIEGNVLQIFVKNLANLSLAFNWRGDAVWTVNVPYQPVLDVVSGALFILGIALALYWLVNLRATKYLYLLFALAALLLPSALSIAFPDENPSMVRLGGGIPFLAIVLALPMALFRRTLPRISTHLRTSLIFRALCIGAVLTSVVLLNFQWYFFTFDVSYRQSSENSSEIAAIMRDYANSVSDLQHVYNVSYPYWVDGRAIAINLGDIEWHNFSLNASDLLTDDNANLLYTLHIGDDVNLNILKNRYPQDQVRIIHSRTPGKDFIAFFVPAALK